VARLWEAAGARILRHYLQHPGPLSLSREHLRVALMFTLAKDTKLDIARKIDGTVLALGTVVTCDPNAGNGIKFTKMLHEDQEELRCCLDAAQEASESST